MFSLQNFRLLQFFTPHHQKNVPLFWNIFQIKKREEEKDKTRNKILNKNSLHGIRKIYIFAENNNVKQTY